MEARRFPRLTEAQAQQLRDELVVPGSRGRCVFRLHGVVVPAQGDIKRVVFMSVVVPLLETVTTDAAVAADMRRAAAGQTTRRELGLMPASAYDVRAFSVASTEGDAPAPAPAERDAWAAAWPDLAATREPGSTGAHKLFGVMLRGIRTVTVATATPSSASSSAEPWVAWSHARFLQACVERGAPEVNAAMRDVFGEAVRAMNALSYRATRSEANPTRALIDVAVPFQNTTSVLRFCRHFARLQLHAELRLAWDADDTDYAHAIYEATCVPPREYAQMLVEPPPVVAVCTQRVYDDDVGEEWDGVSRRLALRMREYQNSA